MSEIDITKQKLSLFPPLSFNKQTNNDSETSNGNRWPMSEKLSTILPTCQKMLATSVVRAPWQWQTVRCIIDITHTTLLLLRHNKPSKPDPAWPQKSHNQQAKPQKRTNVASRRQTQNTGASRSVLTTTIANFDYLISIIMSEIRSRSFEIIHSMVICN